MAAPDAHEAHPSGEDGARKYDVSSIARASYLCCHVLDAPSHKSSSQDEDAHAVRIDGANQRCF